MKKVAMVAMMVMAQLGDAYPHLQINKKARNPLIISALASALGLEGAHEVYKYLK